MVIKTNVSALTSHRALRSVSNSQSRSSERLSTGLRINRASDDAAGLAISEKMRSQIRGLDQATTNAQDGISLVQTAEGAMQESQAILQRMRELAVQAGNDTLEDTDRDKIQEEISLLIEELDAISTRTEFNGRTLLDGSLDGRAESEGEGQGLWIQTGANGGQGITIHIPDLSSESLGVTEVNVTVTDVVSDEDEDGNVVGPGQSITSEALEAIDAAISLVSSARSVLGAGQNRLDHTINSLEVSSENLSAANSRIQDTDMAKEMMRLTQANVLQQAEDRKSVV